MSDTDRHIDLNWRTVEGREPVGDLAAQENFPVAARFLPAQVRRRLFTLYGYARLVDDAGDEAEPERRGALLDAIEADLDRAYTGVRPELPIMRAVAALAAECAVPREPFDGLLAANRLDQTVIRYETFDDLLDYCALSAAPVGRLVLHVFDAATPARIARSDKVCAALQVVEHCQDVGEDYERGRIYLPQQDLRRFGCAEDDLKAATTPTRLRGVVALQTARARELLDQGAPITGSLHGWARLAVSGYVAGGRAALAALERGGHDVLGARLRPHKARLLGEWVKAGWPPTQPRTNGRR